MKINYDKIKVDDQKIIKDHIDDIVDTIIKLPIKNLEGRIKNIQNDLKLRQKIFDSSLSILRNREIEIEFFLSKMNYILGNNNELKRKLFLENELSTIVNTKINSTVSHFQDTNILKEKLQTANEQLVIEREKGKLVD